MLKFVDHKEICLQLHMQFLIPLRRWEKLMISKPNRKLDTGYNQKYKKPE